ncbi:MAG: L-iditol 2-dehydrogenase [Thermomicrobiales bacterium]
MKLDGKVAMVTGAGSGMGAAIARAYAREGAKVVVADINLDAAQATVDAIAGAGSEAIAVYCDVRDSAQAQAAVDAAVTRFGGLDILVNNAGVIKIIPFLETTEADWDFMFDINCKGLLWCSQAAARQMIAQGRGGKIVNLASQAGRRGESLVLAYCASKACVISMTQSMALALAPHKINVNGIAPGIVDTPLWVEVDKQFAALFGWEVGEPKRRFVESIPLGRIEQPDDVTGAAIFLASADSDYMTQQTINVDGGNWPG